MPSWLLVARELLLLLDLLPIVERKGEIPKKGRYGWNFKKSSMAAAHVQAVVFLPFEYCAGRTRVNIGSIPIIIVKERIQLTYQTLLFSVKRNRRMNNNNDDVIDVDDDKVIRAARRRKPKRFNPDEVMSNTTRKQGRLKSPPPKASKVNNNTEVEEVVITEVVHQPAGLRRSVRRLPAPIIKMENQLGGTFQCPTCKGAVLASEKGCNVLTCRSGGNHNNNNSFFYFCCHCKKECPDGYAVCQCPKRNDKAARAEAQMQRNQHAKSNPIELLDDSSSDEQHLPPGAVEGHPVAVADTTKGDEKEESSSGSQKNPLVGTKGGEKRALLSFRSNGQPKGNEEGSDYRGVNNGSTNVPTEDEGDDKLKEKSLAIAGKAEEAPARKTNVEQQEGRSKSSIEKDEIQHPKKPPSSQSKNNDSSETTYSDSVTNFLDEDEFRYDFSSSLKGTPSTNDSSETTDSALTNALDEFWNDFSSSLKGTPSTDDSSETTDSEFVTIALDEFWNDFSSSLKATGSNASNAIADKITTCLNEG